MEVQSCPELLPERNTSLAPTQRQVVNWAFALGAYNVPLHRADLIVLVASPLKETIAMIVAVLTGTDTPSTRSDSLVGEESVWFIG